MRSNKIPILFLILVLIAGCSGGGGSGSNGGTVTPSPTLVSLAVTPSNPNPSIALGIAEQFTATGTYSNGSHQDLTTSVTWTSSNTAVATISNTAGLKGLAASKSVGSTTITAASGKVVSAPVPLTVAPKAIVSIDVEPAFSSISTGSNEQYTATGTYSDNTTGTIGDLTTSVTWTSTIPGVAIISNSTGSQGLATSIAPGTTMIAARSGNAPGSALLTVTTGTAAPAVNVLPITVNGSLCSAANSNGYLNKPCVSVKVCTHGSTIDCDTINDILLDTGSFGLRIFNNQVLTANLTQVPAGSGSLAECAQFGDGSSEWGPVKLADVILGNETASNVPIQVIDSLFGTLPTGCSNADPAPSAAGFNGILGIGVFIQDCGPACVDSAGIGLYYACSGASCSETKVPLASQVSNPVALLTSDNNGVIVELPSVLSAGTISVSGILVLGIDTKPNNASSGATLYSTDEFGEIVTILNGIFYNSIIDSGSNGLFFSAPSRGLLPDCTVNTDWFCPSSVTTLSATNEDASLVVNSDVFFQIRNFDTLTGSSNNVFSNIGGFTPNFFDWGLPFYLGRSVYVGIEGTSSNLGSGTLGPYFAY